MSHSPSPLQIATKIHFYLMRELGRGIDVEQMLQHPRYARDVLLVCDACAGTELADLAGQYRKAKALYESLEGSRPGAAPGRARQATDWSRNTTGFGLSRPLDDDAMQPAPGPATSSGMRQWLTRWRQR